MNRDQIRAALAAQNRDARVRKEVPEIMVDGEPLVAFFAPINTGDMTELGDRIERGDPSSFVDLFIRKAQTESGAKIFEPADRVWLLETLPVTAANELLAHCAVGLELKAPAEGENNIDAQAAAHIRETEEN